MSLHKPPASILSVPYPELVVRHLNTGPENHLATLASDDPIHRTLATAAEHHEHQFLATAINSGVVVVDDHELDFPRHVHSVKRHGDYLVANDANHHASLLASGEWADTPLEIVGKEAKSE